MPYEPTLDEAISHITYGQESLATIYWLIRGLTIFTCVCCCLVSSRYFTDGNYSKGKIALIGAAIAGSAPQLAKLFLFE